MRIADEQMMKAALREELVEELIQICNARIQKTEEQSQRQILIQGAWRQFEVSQGAVSATS